MLAAAAITRPSTSKDPARRGVYEGHGREPQGPHREALRGGVGLGLAERLPSLDELGHRGQAEEGGPRQGAHHHAHHHRDVERHHEAERGGPGPPLAQDDRQRADPQGLVEGGLVDVLAHEHRRAQQSVGDRGHHDLPGQVPHRGVVGPAHHERSPHQEDVGLAQSPLLEAQRRGGVGDRQREPRQGEAHHRPSPVGGQHHQDGEVGDVHDQCRAGQASPRHHARQHGMRCVQGARVRHGVGTDLGVEEVVHEVVGAVGQDQAGEGEDEQSGVEAAAVHGQARRHRAGHEGHGKDGRPGEHEPARHHVEGTPRGRVGGAQHLDPGREPALGGPRAGCVGGLGQHVAHLGMVPTGAPHRRVGATRVASLVRPGVALV